MVSFIPFITKKNSIDPIVFSIQQISKDVTDQGAIGQAAEIRDIRLNGLENAKLTGNIKARLEHVEKVVERNAAKVSELCNQVQGIRIILSARFACYSTHSKAKLFSLTKRRLQQMSTPSIVVKNWKS